MADRLALVIAVEIHQDPDIPACAHTESDALAFAHALEPFGFRRDLQVILTGSQATRTAIESRLRKLSRNPPEAEALFVYWSGHAFSEQGESYLACFDTQMDDLAPTAVAVRTLLEALAASRCQRLVLFLDPRGEFRAEPLSSKPIADFFGKEPTAACLLSCQEGETSQLSGSLKGGIWAHLIVAALTGKAPRALEEGRWLTATSLEAYLEQEVPRCLRETFREAPKQTPCLLGPASGRLVLADVGALVGDDQPNADPRLQPLRRGALRGETPAKVKSLAGFRKFHRLPERVNASARHFVAELAVEDVKQDVDVVYGAVRESLGYKRRDVTSSAENNSGFVRTPDFEYSVLVELSNDDPTTVYWRREVAGIRTPEVVLGKSFQKVFGAMFDTLVFEFARPFDLEAWVDQIEEEAPAKVKLRCAADCSSCDVTIAGFTGVVRLFRDRVEVQGRQEPGSKGLVEAFLHFQDLFSGQKNLQALPLLENSAECK